MLEKGHPRYLALLTIQLVVSSSLPVQSVSDVVGEVDLNIPELVECRRQEYFFDTAEAQSKTHMLVSPRRVAKMFTYQR